MGTAAADEVPDDLDEIKARAAQRHGCFDFDDLDRISDSEARAARQHASFDFDDLELKIQELSASVDVLPLTSPQEVPNCSHCQNSAKTPLFFVTKGLECGELIRDANGVRADPVFLYTVGACSETAVMLSGQYVPLCNRQATDCTIEVLVRHDIVVRGTRATPLFVRAKPSPGGASWYARASTHVGQKRYTPVEPLLLAYGLHGSAGWTVLEASGGKALASAPRLDSNWIVWTTVASETEFGLHALQTRDPPPEVLLPPQPWPSSWRPGRPMRLAVRVICMPERAQSAAVTLQHLQELCQLSSVHLDAGLHPAWDTRGQNAETLRDEGFVDAARWEHGPKLLGCALAHSQLWASLAEHKHGVLAGTSGALLILEDDAVINFARPVESILPQILARATDNDITLLGAMADEQWSHECSQDSPPTWLSNHLVRIHFWAGFWGYLITPRGARRALRALWGTARDPHALWGDCDICVACASNEGELDAALCVPHLVLHPGWQGNCNLTRCSWLDYEYQVDAERLIETGARRAGSALQHSRRLAYVQPRASQADSLPEIHRAILRFRDLAAPRRFPVAREPDAQEKMKQWMRRTRSSMHASNGSGE